MKRALAALALTFSMTAANAATIKHQFCSAVYNAVVQGTFTFNPEGDVTPQESAVIKGEVEARATDIKTMLERYDTEQNNPRNLMGVVNGFNKISIELTDVINARISRKIEFPLGQAALASDGVRCTDRRAAVPGAKIS